MAKVIPMTFPALGIDFKGEALTLAVNEACAGTEAALECSLLTPCPECKALANALEQALARAFLAGVASMQREKDNAIPDEQG